MVGWEGGRGRTVEGSSSRSILAVGGGWRVWYWRKEERVVDVVANVGFGGGDLDCRRLAVARRNVEFKMRFAKCAPRQKHFPRLASLSSGRQMLGVRHPCRSGAPYLISACPTVQPMPQCSHPRRHRSVGEWHMLKKRPSLNHSTSSIPRPPSKPQLLEQTYPRSRIRPSCINLAN